MMSTVAAIKLQVKEISILVKTLSDSVLKVSKGDKIWAVMNTEESENPHETFNRRFDAMFGEDCRDSNGRLHYLRQGKLGIGLVVSYLSKIDWTELSRRPWSVTSRGCTLASCLTCDGAERRR